MTASPESQWLELGLTHLRRGELPLAASAYEQAREAAPQSGEAWHYLGLVRFQLGEVELALAYLEQARQLAPSRADFHGDRGNVFQLRGDFAAAEAAFREALACDAGLASTWSNLAVLQRRRGELLEAELSLRAALAIDATHPQARTNLVNVYVELGRFDEARALLTDGQEEGAMAASSLRQLATIHYLLGQREEAAQCYARWLSQDPAHPLALHLYAACAGTEAPPRASDEFVRTLFDDYAATFESSLQRLDYRAPTLLAAAAERWAPPAASSRGTASAAASGAAADLGCGTGLCGPWLKRFAGTLVGVDLSPRMLAEARRGGHYDSLVEAELTAFAAAHPDRFDLIACADTLCYFGALEAPLAAMVSALTPAGRLLFTVELSPAHLRADEAHLLPHGRYAHGEEYVRSCLAQAGGEVLELTPAPLRKEAGKWVDGLVLAVGKRATEPTPDYLGS